MPTGLEILASTYKRHRPGKSTVTDAPANENPLPIAPVSADEPNLETPSAFESGLKYLGLGGSAVRNLLMGNVEGIGRNLVDIASGPVRAALPGDQSNWELSRKQDLPEFSDVIGGMEPGLGKTALDVVGGIVTDPLSYVGVGEFTAAAKAAKTTELALQAARATKDVAKVAEATKAAQVTNNALKASRAAGETKTGLGIGPAPFMAPRLEIPGSSQALSSIGQGIKAVTPPVVKEAAAKGMEYLAPKLAAAGHGLRKTFAALKPSDEAAANVAGAEALGGAARTAGMESPIATNAAFSPDVQEKAHLLLEDVIKNETAPIGAQFGPLNVGHGLSNFGTREDQIAAIDSRLAKTPWDEATKGQVREAAIANSDFYREQFKQATQGTVLNRPNVWMQGQRVVPEEHLRGLHGEEVARVEKNKSLLERELSLSNKRAARQEAKIQELAPLHEQAATAALASGTTADELLSKMPDLASRAKTLDALDLKLANWEGAANTLGSLSKGTGMRSAKLEQSILDNRDAIAQAKQAATALRKAREGGADPALLEQLRSAASEATANAKNSQLDLITQAKTGKFGELIDTHQEWTGLKAEANAAAKAVREAKQAGLDEGHIAELKKDLLVKKEAADGAARKLQSLVPRLSEASGLDAMIMGRLANKQGKLREIRQLMAQLDDPDLANLDVMTRQGYRAQGTERASTAAAERAFNRLQRAQGNLEKAQEMRPTLESALEGTKAPKFNEFANEQGYANVQLPETHAPLDYIPRQIEQAGEDTAVLANILKGRSVTDRNALLDLLNTPGAKLESNLGKIGAQYGQQMGRNLTKAAIGQSTVGPAWKALVDPDSKAAYQAVVEQTRKAGDLDTAHVLDQTMNGLPKQGKFMKAISTLNKPFKQSVTAGVIVPNLNFTVGNIVSNVVQAASNPEARSIAWSQLKSLPKVIAGSMNDGLTRLGLPQFTESMANEVTRAARQSNGTAADMLRRIGNTDLRLAVQHGVLDSGFIDAEELAAKATDKAGWRNPKNILFWTQEVAKGSEQRMRFGMFKDLLKTHTPADAARIVDDTLFNYKYASEANRIARQIIPFGQFSFKAVPQAAKFLAEKPAAAEGIRALYAQKRGSDNPLPPWTQGNVNLPLGKGASGNPQYLTSFRMPFEQLAKIPNPSGNLGDILGQTKQDVVGQASPLIKTGIAAFGGNDPGTGQPFMSNDRTPLALQALGAPANSELARKFNAAVATGLPGVAQVGAGLTTLGKLLNNKQSVPVTALNALTGLRVIDVDEAQALKQIIQDAIARNPSIKATASYYELNKTPEGQNLLNKLKHVRAELRAKKKATLP